VSPPPRLPLTVALWYGIDFVVAKLTPTLVTKLGYKVFFMFGTVNIAGMAVFAL
jgi:hypothetical protein